MDHSIPLFRDMTIQLGSRTLLCNQTLSVDRGTVTVLMGPSGVGKSILTDAVFRLPRAEELHIKGEQGDAAAVGALVVQEGGGLPHLTVEDNLRLVSGDGEQRQRLIERFDLPREQISGSLSGGEKRRLATALALHAQRQLLWLDEPDTGLDVQRLQDLANLLLEQARRDQRAIVVVTHNTIFAVEIADRILFLAQDGSLDCLRANSPTELTHELQQRIATPDRPNVVPSKAQAMRWPFTVHPTEWLVQMGDGALWAWTAISHVPARGTFRHALKLAAWDGAFFYPFIGLIFGGVFVFIFELAASGFDAVRVLAEVGPTIVMRFCPPAAALLVASCAGSTISSWLGQMTATRVLDTLQVLGNFVPRYVNSPVWFGLTLAGITNATSFAIAVTLVFAGYILTVGTPESFESFWNGFLRDYQLSAAVLKTVGFSVLVSGVTLSCATSPKHAPEDVAAAVTQGIVWSSVVVMATELLLLAIDYLWL